MVYTFVLGEPEVETECATAQAVEGTISNPLYFNSFNTQRFGDMLATDSFEMYRGQTQICLQNALRDFLKLLPEVQQESLQNTPARFVKALTEMTSGYASSPEEILSKTFEDDCDEIIVVRGISFSSVCEHHLLPFIGTADIGYLPGKVVGLSKLPRLVDCFARRLQMQERLTRQISEALMTHLNAKGAAVITRATHTCMSCRGVRKEGAEMVCSSMLGVFRDEPSARAEFLTLCRS